MPVGWLRSYSEMLPRLRDEEALQSVTLAMAASNTQMTDSTREEFLRSLRQTTPRVPKSQRPRVTIDDLRAAGISVKEVPVV